MRRVKDWCEGSVWDIGGSWLGWHKVVVVKGPFVYMGIGYNF